jgi:hypothetical protein
MTTLRTEYAVEYPAGYAHVTDDLADAEEWAQWIVDGRVVARTVQESPWRRVDGSDEVEVDEPAWFPGDHVRRIGNLPWAREWLVIEVWESWTRVLRDNAVVHFMNDEIELVPELPYAAVRPGAELVIAHA